MGWCLMSHLIGNAVNEVGVGTKADHASVVGNGLNLHYRGRRGEIGKRKGQGAGAERDAPVEKEDINWSQFAML